MSYVPAKESSSNSNLPSSKLLCKYNQNYLILQQGVGELVYLHRKCFEYNISFIVLFQNFHRLI